MAVRLTLWLALLALAPGPAAALNIIGNFVPTANPPPSADRSFGGGDPVAIFNAAAAHWEQAILDDHTVTIDWTWAPFVDGTLGVGLPGSSGARPSQGFINFNNIDFDWYFDPTPGDDAEWSGFDAPSLFLGGSEGAINVGRQFNNAPVVAAFAFDFFSIALHEIGHIMGLVDLVVPFGADSAADGDLDVMAPRPFAGAELPTTSTGGGHLDLPDVLMFPFSDPGVRTLLSEADIVAVAQINDYLDIDLSPGRGVPEPGTTWLLASGMLWLGWRLRR